MTKTLTTISNRSGGGLRTILLSMMGFGIGFGIKNVLFRLAYAGFGGVDATPEGVQTLRTLLILLYGLGGSMGAASLCWAMESKRKIPLWMLTGFIICSGSVLLSNAFFRILSPVLIPLWNLIRDAYGPHILASVSTIIQNMVIGAMAGLMLRIIFGDLKQGVRLILGGAAGLGLYGLLNSPSWQMLPLYKTIPPDLMGALNGAAGGAAIGLFLGWSMIDGGDSELLEASPISKKLMHLLWLDDSNLHQIKSALVKNEPITVVMGDSSEQKEWEITRADMNWLDKVIPVALKAYATGQKDNYYQAINYYKQALKLAPGCDLYLMSIGSAYVMIGQKERGIRYLERAAEISPGNKRIRENLNKVTGGATSRGKLPDASPEASNSLPIKKQKEKTIPAIMTAPGIELALRNHLEHLQSDYGNNPGADKLRRICAQLLAEEQLGFIVKSISENLPHALSEKKPYETSELFTKFAESGYFVAVTIFPWLTPEEVIEFSDEGYSKKLIELGTKMAVIDFRSPEASALGILPWTHLVHWIYCCDGEDANVHLTLIPESVNPEADRTVFIIADELLSPAEKRQMGL